MVILYKKPYCRQCSQSAKLMDSLGIEYELIDITKDATALEYIKGLGYRQAPVIVSETESWSGYDPDKIRSILK